MTEGGNVSALACGTETALGREVWALVDTRLQKWSVAMEGWEECILDEELVGIVRAGIRNAFSSAPRDSMLDLELLDLTVAR
jgi:nuclear pore complex protein Nup133